MELSMGRLGIVTSAVAALAFGQAFSFTIGSPVASLDGRSKMAAFVFRTEGCADPTKAQVDGTAEGLVRGTRKSVSLKLAAMSTPGVYAVYPTWPADGSWIVNLHGTCAGASAGALIPIGPGGFIRASSSFFPRPPTPAELDAALHALSHGGGK
jgi:hypothetical protein